MKILFLDIDGVLLPGHWLMQHRDPRYIQPAKVELLNLICQETGCIVVVSSTWRFDDDCRDRLIRAGFTGEFHDHWRTLLQDEPDEDGLYFAKPRSYEIQHWIDAHKPEHFVVLDDLPHAFNDKSVFVRTDFDIGLTLMHVKDAIKILNKDDN